jgi:hypothetical protein
MVLTVSFMLPGDRACLPPEQKYLSENQKKDSTRLSTNSPTGKSPHGGESKFGSCPGRGAAPFALLRRAGTHHGASGTMDPGSAAHHAAKSGAMRGIRGTSGARK